MSVSAKDLRPGDIILNKYRSSLCFEGHEDIAERLIRAEVIHCEPGTWPLARWADGQHTECVRV